MLSPSGLQRHKKPIASPTLPGIDADDAEIRSLMTRVEDEFQQYRSCDLALIKLKSRLNSQRTSSYSIREPLADQPENSFCLEYDRWYRHTKTLCQVPHTSSGVEEIRQSLLTRIEAFNVRLEIQVQVAAQLQPEQPSPEEFISSKDAHNLLEEEIRIGVGRYRFPSPLKFGCQCGVVHLLECTQCLGLLEKEQENVSTISQLRWTRAIIADLKEPHCNSILPPQRINELLKGLVEHRRNVTTHIETERFKNKHPIAPFHAIITSMLSTLEPLHLLTFLRGVPTHLNFQASSRHDSHDASISQIFIFSTKKGY